jgi:hypothetical protein
MLVQLSREAESFLDDNFMILATNAGSCSEMWERLDIRLDLQVDDIAKVESAQNKAGASD